MDLTRASADEIGSALGRAGLTWSFDEDGDVRVRFRSSQQPWIDAVFYRLNQDFSISGQFLNGHAVPQGNNTTRWEVPLDAGREPTAIAQKVVSVYFMPRPGQVALQIHASIAPLNQPRPMHIKIIPGGQQISQIERAYPGFVGHQGSTQFWVSSAITGSSVDGVTFEQVVRTASSVGLEMFEGPFTGWLYSTDL
ncbi:hypothetical protein ISU10_02350 [Nocardioides agariphilus]|uniref:Uncharacterized protein n=1 Tax=Nocardioides agariphilus TaxID=433664 RepID=A0A930VJ75_9ACTN|nr:hypothetical protein [Nocardioides agariphilus]MBF4766606.1 hypothetical protein [Nocardioides agariphilus]